MNQGGIQANNPKHFCCCGCMDVKTGTNVVAAIYMFCSACSLIKGISAMSFPLIATSLLYVVLSMFALMGVSQHAPKKLLGFMFAILINIIILFLVIFGLFTVMGNPKSILPDADPEIARMAICTAILVSGGSIGIDVWFLSTVHNCYNLLKSYNNPNERNEKELDVV
ncbi:hypothetical protein L596_024698 [Steinernema carpocapsae]|uniref:Uncharacterized protein n=1 Tax=Steinernema carpocapsae TaxID=34508 RepID=A0A4U5M5M5_STECR|nr:hypothetical protein L596_024698 [Steinernema carpocapsae]